MYWVCPNSQYHKSTYFSLFFLIIKPSRKRFRSSLWASDISNLPDNSLTQIKVALFVSCKLAKGGISNNSNVVNATFSRGARTVLGFQETIYLPPCLLWAKEFLASVNSGFTITQSIAKADDALARSYWGSGWGLDSLLVRERDSGANSTIFQ